MKGKRRWLLCPLVIVALLLCAIPAYAGVPTIPHAFYGTLTINESSAAVGTVVTAKVGGVECGSFTTTVEGQYGGSGGFDAKLLVSGEIATGATISFYVNDIDTGQTYAFSAGGVTELDLTARDTTAPTVSSTSPADGATGVAVSTTVSVTFNEAMDESTITTSSFTLDSVSGSVSYDSGSYTATFTPDANLEGSTTYTATLSTAITDVASNPLAAEYSWSFTTADITAPTVISVSPLDGATDVAIDAVVSVIFSEDIQEGDNFSGIAISGATGVSASIDGATLTIAHDDFASLTSYTVTIPAGAVNDLAGNPLAAAYSWSFTTADITAPTVISTSPVDGDTGVAVSTTVSVTFSEAMDESTITTSSFTLDSVSGSVSYDSGTYTATFTPDANLAAGTTYTATLSTAITDAAGNPLASAYPWSFTTAGIPPTVTSVSPVDGATDVATYTTVMVTFDMAMDESTITTSSFTLDGVSGSVSCDSGTYTATFTPDANLDSNTTYTATLSTAITSAEGIALASAYSWSFTTVYVGDATEDGEVDARDITKVERIIAGLDAQTPGADATQDGLVDARDITMVERIIAGLD